MTFALSRTYNLWLIIPLVMVFTACSDPAPFGKTNYSFRALHTPDDQTIWLAAQNGFWAHSTDGGTTWDTGHIAGFSGEIRDIESFGPNSAIAMGIESPGILFKTMDGGQTWKEVFRDEHPQNFFDNMDFNEKGQGIVVGDPIDGKWTLIGTNDYGESWIKWHPTVAYDASENDVCFAASGTGLIVGDSEITFFTGGYRSAVVSSAAGLNLELVRDSSSSFGVYSAVKMKNGDYLFVGGDYRFPDSGNHNCGIISTRSGRTEVLWAETPPGGYRSCVVSFGPYLIATGPNGTDISEDGLNWEELTGKGYHVLSVDKRESRIWAAGNNGHVAELTSLLP